MTSSSRARAEAKGRRAEVIALWYLRLKGYRLLARRFKSRQGEIDLIMRRGPVTAFVEVKARKTTDASVTAVSDQQQRRIARAARQWMSRDPTALKGICRFDIISVAPYLTIHHIPNAFYGD